jgi:hypothetical protein
MQKAIPSGMAFLLLELNEGAGIGNQKPLGAFSAPADTAPPHAFRPRVEATAQCPAYFGGGAGVNTSRLRPGSGFGFGLGAFFASFLPLSLLPMRPSMTQKPFSEKPFSPDPYLLPLNFR